MDFLLLANSQIADIVSVWWCVPFLVFLLMIATGPLLYASVWHKYFTFIALGFAALVVGRYFIAGQYVQVLHTLVEYVQFVSLLVALYLASSGMYIEVNYRSRPLVNVIFLAFGSVIANIIGTTGASVLLIRPFISMNYPHVRPYQVVFFIFTVSNVGGALTPIGDPPLFLGFIKGIPFIWTLVHNFLPWVFTLGALLGIFYLIELYYFRKKEDVAPEEDQEFPSKYPIRVVGKRNLLWLALIIGVVFLDPNVIEGVPFIAHHGDRISYVREILLLLFGGLAYVLANRVALTQNEFSFGPIKEVVYVFIGIFATMMPALAWVNHYAGLQEADFLTPTRLFFATGFVSGFLDNAPTYLSFLTAAMANSNMDVQDTQQVLSYATGTTIASSPIFVEAIAISAVFFGALTYVGNAPNFMVYSIARDIGVPMPFFVQYIVKYSLPILVPLYILVWLIFVY